MTVNGDISGFFSNIGVMFLDSKLRYKVLSESKQSLFEINDMWDFEWEISNLHIEKSWYVMEEWWLLCRAMSNCRQALYLCEGVNKKPNFIHSAQTKD